MPFEFDALVNKKKNHPSWRLMAADSSPLIISFLDLVFREKNLRQIREDEMKMKLDDYLFHLRDGQVEDPFPRNAAEYLEEWTTPGKDWLRKFYPPGSDTPHYDLTPGTEQVLQWVDGLFVNQFIGTEGRLNTCMNLLREIVNGVEKNKEVRIQELKNRKEEIDREISRLEYGDVSLMDERQIKERFLQFRKTARELLSDFRAVEDRFRGLDRDIREEIATWEGEKGELLEQFFGNHDLITNSDEGESFRAFWNFIMSPDSQEELSQQLDKVFQLKELGDLREDTRLKRIHFDWMEAGEQTQRTVARLSSQLRRYLDDRTYWENKRIVEILDEIEKKAVGLKTKTPTGDWMELEDPRIRVNLLMEFPLFSPPTQRELISRIEILDDDEVDTEKLFQLIHIDRERLQQNIEAALSEASQVQLGKLLLKYPLEHGLAELITYLAIAEDYPLVTISSENQDVASWTDNEGILREARFPSIIFSRRSSYGVE